MRSPNKVQLPPVGAWNIAIQKRGGKIHAAFGGNGSTIGRSHCDHRIHGRIVTGECDPAAICKRCTEATGGLWPEHSALPVPRRTA